MRILIVEDNRDILANMLEYFSMKGHIVDCAMDGLSGLHLAATGNFDLIVLDLMLPALDGLEICRRLRQDGENAVPIIMLTARDTLDERLRGFASGADDYLVKPFALAELEARIEAILRRSRGGVRRVLEIADLRYDLDAMEVTRAGHTLKLTPACYKLLEELMRKSPAVVSRERLEETLWGDDPPDGDVLRSHIHQLRQAIDKPFATRLLHTVHGLGFRIMSAASESHKE